jgi:hypothetical protein
MRESRSRIARRGSNRILDNMRNGSRKILFQLQSSRTRINSKGPSCLSHPTNISMQNLRPIDQFCVYRTTSRALGEPIDDRSAFPKRHHVQVPALTTDPHNVGTNRRVNRFEVRCNDDEFGGQSLEQLRVLPSKCSDIILRYKNRRPRVWPQRPQPDWISFKQDAAGEGGIHCTKTALDPGNFEILDHLDF